MTVGFRNATAIADRFVGRNVVLTALADAVAASRLVTIVGPGGAGKTRTVHELFARHGDRLAPDGAWLVDLAEARDETTLVAEVASALGVSSSGDATARIVDALETRGQVALVLDDFEKLVAHAAFVAALVEGTTRTSVIVTSREALRLPSELRFELGPLDEAVELFVERARSVRADFDPRDDERAEVASLVEALDGLPLAIELAAARSRVLAPRQLREHLTRRFELLRKEGNPRRSTLRGAIDASWVLLSPIEQTALAQCSVFRGGFSLADAEAVIDLRAHESAPWVLDVVQALEERSLLRASVSEDSIRYHLYESIRDYAREKLDATGASETLARRDERFASRSVTLAELADGREAAAALRALVVERENVIAAQRNLVACAQGALAIDRALATTSAIDVVLAMRGPSSLRLELFDTVLAATSRFPDVDPASRARAHLRRAGARIDVGRPAEAEDDRIAAAAIAQQLADPILQGRVDEAFGFGAWHRGDIATARTHFERAAASFHAHDRRLEARTSVFLANALYFLGQSDEARPIYRDAIRTLREEGDLRTLALAFANLGSLEHDAGALDEARQGYLEALEIERALGMRSDEGIARMNLGHLALEEGDIARARVLYGEAIAILREVGNRRWQGIALGYVGLCDEIEQRWEEARVTYVQSIEMHEVSGDVLFLGLSTCWLARLRAKRGLFAEARTTLATGADALARAGAKPFEHVAILCAAEIAIAAGDADARERASQAVNDAAAHVGRSSEVRIALRMLEETIARPLSGGPRSVRPPPGATLEVSRSGRWFRSPEGAPVDLSTRAPLRRLLLALIELRLTTPDRAITLDALVTHGWPGEKLLGTTGPDRAYAALSSLRKMGLRTILIRRDDGYLLDPRVAVSRVDDE